MKWLGSGQQCNSTMCPADGCTMSGSRAEVASHASTCQLLQVACPRNDIGCVARCPRGLLAMHVSSCPFVLMSSFVAESRARIEALERDNRVLRSEIRTLTALTREHDACWHAAQRCDDCGSLRIAEALDPQGAAASSPSPQGPTPTEPPLPHAMVNGCASFPLRRAVRSPFGRCDEDTIDTVSCQEEGGDMATSQADMRAKASASVSSTRTDGCSCRDNTPLRLWRSQQKRARLSQPAHHQ